MPVRNQILEIDLVNSTVGGSVDAQATTGKGYTVTSTGTTTTTSVSTTSSTPTSSNVLDEWQKNDSKLVTKVSPLIEGQVPDFVQAEHPVFVNFLKDYYQFLEAGRITYTGARRICKTTNKYFRIYFIRRW